MLGNSAYLLLFTHLALTGLASTVSCHASDENICARAERGDTYMIEEEHLHHVGSTRAPRVLLQTNKDKSAAEALPAGMSHSEKLFVSAESRSSYQPSKLTPQTRRLVFISVSCFATLLLLVIMKKILDAYEDAEGPTAMPWYLDSRMLALVGGTSIVYWLTIGIFAFTHVIGFGEDETHLTYFEALYLCVQILTTVGYGDFTPTRPLGQVFMSCYILIGVSLVAMMLSEMLNQLLSWKTIKVFGNRLEGGGSGGGSGTASPPESPTKSKESEEDEDDEDADDDDDGIGRYSGFLASIPPYAFSVAIGTLFFHLYPGEGKTIWEGLYMSTVTLTTVGFGAFHPVTQGGYLFASIWMLIGVGATANMIVSLGDCVLRHRKNLVAEQMSANFLAGMDNDGSGSVDKVEFLCFELARKGLCDSDETKKILERFDKLDTDGSGCLDINDIIKSSKVTKKKQGDSGSKFVPSSAAVAQN